MNTNTTVGVTGSSDIVTEEATSKLRLKNGVLQQGFKVDRINKDTNAYHVYLEWRNVEEVGSSTSNWDTIYLSSNWPSAEDVINTGDFNESN